MSTGDAKPLPVPRSQTSAGLLARALTLATLLVPVLLAGTAWAAPGSVDRSFGHNGIADTELEPHYAFTQFTSVTPQPDGSLIAVREALEGGGAKLRRYESNGSLDPSFPPQPAPKPSPPEAVQEDGKVLVVERLEYGGGENYRLERFNPDKTPDTTFNGSGKSETVPFPIETIVLLSSGKILVAGAETYEYTSGTRTPVRQVSLARFGSEGKLDTGFGTGGVVKLHTDYGLTGVFLRGIALRSGEGTLLLLNSYGESGGAAFLVALTAAGTLDPSYGSAGKVQLNASITDFHALNEDKVLVAGSSWGAKLAYGNGYASDFFLARYTHNGQPDSSFAGGAGTAGADFGGVDLAHAVLWEGDGSVLIGGSTTAATANCLYFHFCGEESVLVRFTPDGQLDSGFGTGGLLRLPALISPAETQSGRGVEALAARLGGGAFAAGGSGTAAFIAALGPGGALDSGFGAAGIVTERDPFLSGEQAEAVAVDLHGRILVAGRSNAGGTSPVPGGAVIRYLPNGRLDRSFGHGTGYLRVPGGGEAIAIAPNGSSFALAGGYDPSVTKITPSGELDASFGEEGTVRLDPRFKLGLQMEAIAALPGGAVLVAGQIRHGGPRIVVFRLGPKGGFDRAFGRHGMAVLDFGRRRPWGVRQLAVQPDGRILLAGYMSRKRSEPWSSRTLALMRLLADGAPDRSFGRGGAVTSRVGGTSEAMGVATQAGKILVASRARRAGRVADLLLRYTANGRLDRRFARAGIARVSVSPLNGPAVSNKSLAVLPTPRHILLVRAGQSWPVLAFWRNGRLDRSFARRRGIAPGRAVESYLPPGPVGALQHGKLILAWTTRKANEWGGTNPMIDLQRLTSR